MSIMGVSHQNFVTTSPHPFIRSEESATDTPMIDISPFLQPPAFSDISDIHDHQHSLDPHHQEHIHEPDQEHHHQESQEDSQTLLQSALGQVSQDVISRESRRHPPSGPSANKKGKFVVRGKIRFKNRKKKGRSSSVTQGKKSSDNVFQPPRPPPQGPSRRRGKKSDDNGHNHHVNHRHLSDLELEEEILLDKSSFSSGLRPLQEPAIASRRTQGIRDKTDTIVQIQAA